jgi:hypothetical protein
MKKAGIADLQCDANNRDIRGASCDEVLTALVNRALPFCMDVVRKYVPVDPCPVINVVTGGQDIRLPDGDMLPGWVKALSIMDNVYLLADRGPWDEALVRVVLTHELFHSATWIYLAASENVPVWFNEAVAHWITKCELTSDLIKTKDRLSVGARRLVDTYADAQTEVFISYLIRSNCNAYTIRRLLELVKNGKRFSGAVYDTLGLDMDNSRGDSSGG